MCRNIRKKHFLWFLLFAAFLIFVGCNNESCDHYECDPSIPVVLNGDTLIEGSQISRSPNGCVIGINWNVMLDEPNMLYGIDAYSAYLQELVISASFVEYYGHLNLFPLSSCGNLKRLEICSFGLDSIDLSPISSCGSLLEFKLCGNYLTELDISPLASCTRLKKIYLGSGAVHVVNISSLSACTELEELSMNFLMNFYYPDSLITINLSSLASCTKVKLIELENPAITYLDLTPLWFLSSLQVLNLRNCHLDSSSCAQVCSFIADHPDCEVLTDCDCARK